MYRFYQLGVLGLVAAGLAHHLDKLDAPLGQRLEGAFLRSEAGLPLAFGGLMQEARGWRVTIEQTETGAYPVTLVGPQGDQLFIRYHPTEEVDVCLLCRGCVHL